MAELSGNHIGSVYIKVRPDTKDFREEVDRDLKRPLEVDAAVKPTVDSSELDKTEREIQRTIAKMEGRGFSVKVNHDHDSLNAAVKKIEDKLKDIEAVTIQLDTDKESLEEARKVFQELRDEHPVEISYTQDEAGYQKVLAKIAAIRAERTIKTIEFATDEASLARMEREIQDALDSLAPPADPLRVMFGSDRDGIAQGVAQVQAELDKLALTSLDVELDEDSLRQARAKLEDLQQTAKVRMMITQDEAGYQKVLAKIAAIRAERLSIGVTFDTDEESLKAIEREAFQKVVELKPQVPIDHAARTEAALALLGRDRWVEFKPRVAARAKGVLDGLFLSLAGLNTVADFRDTVEHILMNFDQVVIGAGQMSAAIGTAVSVGSMALGSLLVTARDIAGAFQAMALAPAMLLSGAAGLMAWQSIWGGINAALLGIPGALEALPPHAQKAVKAIEDLQDATTKAVQDGFWEQMNSEIYRFIENVGPTVVTIMGQTAREYGRAISLMLDHTSKLVENGKLDEFAKNNALVFHNLADAAVPAFEAFMILGIQGSNHLAQMMQTLEDASIAFRDFIAEAERTGQIDRWIRTGVNAIKDLGSATVSTFRILGNITDIFEQLNVYGLKEMTRLLRDVDTFTAGAGFQRRMTTIFQGAKEGAAAAAEGFGTVMKTLYELDEVIAQSLKVSGELAEAFMDQFSNFLNQPVLHTGFLDAMQAMIEFVNDAQPAVESFSRTLGELGHIGAEVVRQIAPGLNLSMGLIEKLVSALGPGLIAAVDPLTHILEDLTALSQGPLVLAAHAVSGLLSAFSQLNPVIQNTVLTLALLNRVGAMSKIATWFAPAKEIPARMNAVANSVGQVDTRIQTVAGSLARLREVNRRTATVFSSQWANASSGIGRQWAVAEVGITRSLRGIQRAFTGLWSAMGGLPGLAIGGVIAALSALAGANAEAESHVEALTQALHRQDQQALRTEVFDMMTDQLIAFKEAGGDVGKVMDEIAAGNWQKVEADLRMIGETIERTDKGMQVTREQWDATREAALRYGIDIGPTINRGHRAAMESAGELGRSLLDNSGNMSKAQARAAAMGDALGEAGQNAEDAADSLDSIAKVNPRFEEITEAIAGVRDEASSTEERISALDEAIKLLGDKPEGIVEFQKHALKTMDEVIKDLQGMVDESPIDMSTLFKDGSLDTAGDMAAVEMHDQWLKVLEASNSNMIALRKQYENEDIGLEEFNKRIGQEYQKLLDQGDTMGKALKLTGEDLEEFKAVWEDFVLTEMPEGDLRVALSGAVDVEADIARLKELGLEFSMAEYAATFDADSSGYVDEQERVSGLGEIFGDTIYQALLDGDDEGMQQAYLNAANAGAVHDGSNWIASLDANGQPTEAALAAALGMGMTWHGSQYKAVFDANGQPTAAALQIAKTAGLDWKNDTWVSTLDANTKPTKEQVAAAKLLGFDWKNDQWVSTLDANKDPATGKIRDAKGKANDFEGQYIAQLTATDNASGTIANVARKLAALKDRNIKINTQYSTSGSMGRKVMEADGGVFNSVTATGMRFSQNAYGPKPSAFKAFANGGFENHVAHITSPSTPIRIWSEPETHGEAYIPMSSAKRTRSLAIWQEVGRRFGVYADGGINGGVAPAGNAYTINVARSGATGGDIAQAIDYYQRRARRV